MAAISEESLELEAMRKEDCAWHPCRISLRLSSSTSASFDVIVDFGSAAAEEIISNKEEALTRLRFRSIPLQHGECFDIKEGECVLAMQKVQSRSLFFDAAVEKAGRVKHSNRVYCRCSFEIKWIHSELKGNTLTLSPSSIMKLSRKSISSHPVVAEFLSSLNPAKCLEVPSYLSLLGETNGETDHQGLLEKQIEEISKLADASKGLPEEILLGVKRDAVDLTRLTRSKAVVASQINPLHGKNDFTRSTRSQNKRLEMEAENHLEDRPFLSPLAARAALASLVHGLPQKPELSICPVEKEGYVDPPPKYPKKHINIISLDSNHKIVKSDAGTEENISDVSNYIQNTTSNFLREAIHESKSQNSKQIGTLKKSQSTKESLQVDKDQMTRLTRASVQKVKQDFIDGVDQVLLNENEKLNPSIKEKSVTRSVVQKGKQDLTGGIEERLSKEDEKLNPFIKVQITRSIAQKGKQDLTGGVEEGLSNENKKLNAPIKAPRLTCPTKKQQKGYSTVATQEQRKRKLTHDVHVNVPVEGLVTPKNNESKKKKPVTLSVDEETNLLPEYKKRPKSSSAIATAKKDRGEGSGDGKSPPAVKRKTASSKKPELRFSPRLRFLPRTRSQKNSSEAC